MKRGVTGLFLLLATACVVGGCGAKKDAQIDASAQAAEGDAAEETADTQTDTESTDGEGTDSAGSGQDAQTGNAGDGAGGSSADGTTGEEAQPVSLTLWYTQPELEAYFTQAAADYEAQTGNSVTAVQVPALDYIEAINDASVKDGDYPDLFVATPDLLEKAKLAGLTQRANEDICSADNFSEKALTAVTYKDEKIAYPFYADTSVLVYNENYVSEAPGSIEDIQNFSENFEGDGQIQDIFVWNVNDIFVDFFTIGNYVNLGGAAGDRVQEMTLNSEEIRNCLTVYQELSQFFAIDRSAVSENQIVQDFADGKIVYAIVRDDSIQKLDELLADGQFSYGVAPVPDLNSELVVRPLSITHSLVVNGYTKHPAAADALAGYLTVTAADSLYEQTGNIPVKNNVTFANEKLSVVRAQYEEAVEVPKIMQMSSYWLLMESVFSDIWSGADVTERMAEAESSMLTALGQ